MPRKTWILSFAILTAGHSFPAGADVVISIGSTTAPGPSTVDVAQGGTATIGIWVSSTADAGSPDVINEYGVDLQINGPGFLHFAPSGSQDFVNYLSNGQYLFVQPFGFNNSFNGASNTPGGSIQTVNYSNDTFLGADSTNDLSPVLLSSSTGYLLLASLKVMAPTNDVTIGDTYTLGFDTGSGNTFFDQFLVPNSGVNVSSAVPGDMMITPAAVPEPSSIVSGLAGMLIVLALHGVRRLRRFKASFA